MTMLQRPSPMNAEAIALPRFDVGKITMPAMARDLWKIDSGFAARFVEQAQFYAFGHFREQREVCPRAIVGGAERIGVSRPDFHWKYCPCSEARHPAGMSGMIGMD